MGRTKELLQEDWEREWEKDFVYLLEEQKRQEMEELHHREPAEIVVIKKTKSKKKDESKLNILPF